MIRIISNHHPRPVIFASELTEADVAALGFTPDEDASLVRYRGDLYLISDFSHTTSLNRDTTLPTGFAGWHGYASDSFFSGVVVRYTEDNDFVVVGRYFVDDEPDEDDPAAKAAATLSPAALVDAANEAVALNATEPHDCDRCGTTYDEASGDGYCGLCPLCADADERAAATLSNAALVEAAQEARALNTPVPQKCGNCGDAVTFDSADDTWVGSDGEVTCVESDRPHGPIVDDDVRH